MYDYGYVINASWLVLITIWVIGSFIAKPDVSSRPRIIFWVRSIILLGLLIFVLRNIHDDAVFLGRVLFNFNLVINWVGAFLTVVGVAFAIWARFRLGRNWGSDAKKDPVLVTNGPYAYVRHPIYSGVILALFGSALTGSIVDIVLFIIAIIFCLRRIHKEERTMLSLFSEQYSAYQARTKKLIPLVW